MQNQRLFIFVLILAIILGIYSVLIYKQNNDIKIHYISRIKALSDSLRVQKGDFVDSLEIVKRQTLASIQDKRVHEIYPEIREYKGGKNLVNESYLISFEKKGSHIFVQLENGTQKKIQPGYKITFLDQFGVVVYELIDYWIFSKMEPGETRIHDEESVYFRKGNPLYYLVEVD